MPLVAALLEGVGGVGGHLWLTARGGTAPSGPGPVVPDGPTLVPAFSAVENPVSNAFGGPGALVSVFGVAAQAPFSPNVVGGVGVNRTQNPCSREYNGLTLYNGSIPVFNGTFNSGTAPFWPFAF